MSTTTTYTCDRCGASAAGDRNWRWLGPLPTPPEETL